MGLRLLLRRASVSKSIRRNSLLQYQQSDYKKSRGRIFGAATPHRALVLNGSLDLAARAIVLKAFYLTRPNLLLLKSLP